MIYNIQHIYETTWRFYKILRILQNSFEQSSECEKLFRGLKNFLAWKDHPKSSMVCKFA